jgi:hypothetical protein
LTVTDDDRRTTAAVTELPDDVQVATEEGRRLAEQLSDAATRHARKLLEVRNLTTHFFT